MCSWRRIMSRGGLLGQSTTSQEKFRGATVVSLSIICIIQIAAAYGARLSCLATAGGGGMHPPRDFCTVVYYFPDTGAPVGIKRTRGGAVSPIRRPIVRPLATKPLYI